MSPNRTAERTAFEQTYRENYGAVFGYLSRRLERGVVEDAASEVFVVAWHRRASMPDHPIGWLLGVAANIVAQHYRGQQRQHRLIHAVQLEDHNGETPDIAQRVSEQAATRQALMTLSPTDREVLLLSAWEDLDTTQGASAIGCSPGAYRVRLTRARARFRAALAEADRAAHPVSISERDIHVQ